MSSSSVSIDSRISRSRIDDNRGFTDRSTSESDDYPVSGVAVTAVFMTYPTVASSAYYLQGCQINCADTEGAVATIVNTANSFFFGVNLGSSVPPQGTAVIYSNVGGVISFRYDG